MLYLSRKGGKSKLVKFRYEKVNPVLFEFQSAQYLSTGSVIAKCWDIGKDYQA